MLDVAARPAARRRARGSSAPSASATLARRLAGDAAELLRGGLVDAWSAARRRSLASSAPAASPGCSRACATKPSRPSSSPRELDHQRHQAGDRGRVGAAAEARRRSRASGSCAGSRRAPSAIGARELFLLERGRRLPGGRAPAARSRLERAGQANGARTHRRALVDDRGGKLAVRAWLMRVASTSTTAVVRCDVGEREARPAGQHAARRWRSARRRRRSRGPPRCRAGWRRRS